MTNVEDRLPATESEAPITDQESVRRLIIVAVGWILLAMAPAATVGFVRGFAIGFVRGLTHGASQLQIPQTLNLVMSTVGACGFAVVLLYAASIRGRMVGGGDRRLGLGLAPIAKFPVIVGLSAILVVYAALLDFAVYTYRPDTSSKSSSVTPWLILFDSLRVIILAPLAEELFFRGWLWTGLRKQWGALPTGLVTAVMWLVPHLDRGIGYVALLFFPALILTVAREVGKSVRATIPIHVVYNLTASIPLIALKLFQN